MLRFSLHLRAPKPKSTILEKTMDTKGLPQLSLIFNALIRNGIFGFTPGYLAGTLDTTLAHTRKSLLYTSGMFANFHHLRKWTKSAPYWVSNSSGVSYLVYFPNYLCYEKRNLKQNRKYLLGKMYHGRLKK